MTGESEFQERFDEDAARARLRREEQQLGEAILKAPIRALDPPKAVTVPITATIREATQVMIDHEIGCVLVEDEGRLVGIFTERDVLRRVANTGVDRNLPVTEVMTPDPEALGPDDGVAFALNRMIVHGYRHVPVVDDEGRALGVLSVRHMVGFIVSLMPDRITNLPPDPKHMFPHDLDGG